ncbi:MAG TPA: fibronectin type III domain-containing protein [Desulfobacteraceae bacterium]|nr:fibronectin type III domain-containing protein [Desulfobacteraceae bacterium]
MDVKTTLAVIFMLLLGPDPGWSEGKVTAAWTPNPVEEQISGYKLYYKFAESAEWDGSDAIEGASPIVINGGGTGIITVTGLDPSRSYTFALSAWRNEWNGQPAMYVELGLTPELTVTGTSGMVMVSTPQGWQVIKVE